MDRRAYLGWIDLIGIPLIMSKQFAISAASSVFAMVACVLLVTPAPNEAGALAHAAAPAGLDAVAGLQAIIQ